MAIKTHPGRPALETPGTHSWGELSPMGESSASLRFVLSTRIVTIPISEFKYWEQLAGLPEFLVLHTERQVVTVEGSDLSEIVTAFELGRLREIRSNRGFRTEKQIPRVSVITIEPS